MAQIFFTSDLHFSHKNIAKFCPHSRPHIHTFNNTNIMDNYLIEYWNDTVGVDDIVYNLGDLFFCYDLRQIKRILSQLNGHHHLIFGNHDDMIMNNAHKLLTEKKQDGKPLLASAQSYLKLKLENKTLILFHYPIDEWDGCHKGYYHLHGHIHERMSQVKGRILNVGFDLHQKFLTLDEISDYLEKLPMVAHFGNKNEGVFANLDMPDYLKDSSFNYQTAKHNQAINDNKALLKIAIDNQLKKNNGLLL